MKHAIRPCREFDVLVVSIPTWRNLLTFAECHSRIVECHSRIIEGGLN